MSYDELLWGKYDGEMRRNFVMSEVTKTGRKTASSVYCAGLVRRPACNLVEIASACKSSIIAALKRNYFEEG